LLLALCACSETSLNEAPIIDLSSRAGARAKAPPVAPAPAPGEALYTVAKGDTLYHVASLAHASIPDLARWNGIDEHAPLFVGQRLRLQAPSAGGETAASTPAAEAAAPAAASGESAAPGEAVATPIPLGAGGAVETRTLDAVPSAPVAETPGGVTSAAGLPAAGGGAAGPGAAALSPADAGADAGTAAAGAGLAATAPGSAAPQPGPAVATGTPVPAPASEAAQAPAGSAAASGWIWPVAGPVTGKFDPVRSKGIEIAAPEDAPIVAVADGTVSYTGSPRDYGNLVILKHGDELLSVYAHAKTILVKEGQVVGRGQTIATAGKSPGTVPSTVHFEARRNHVPVDPLELLPLR
jgi:lipoprotein NlpD